MRSEWLEYFSDAVRLGSIKASADKHNISPQGLSKSIRSLENELHVTLFERGANSIRLTTEGEQLLPFVQEAAQSIHSLEMQASSLASKSAPSPILVLCSTFVFFCGMIDPLRKGLSKLDYPATCMQIDTGHMLGMFLNKTDPYCQGKALCGFPLFFQSTDDQNREALNQLLENKYDYIPLLEYHDGILVSKDHPLAHKDTVSKADIVQYPVISSSIEQLLPLTHYLGVDHIQTAIANLATRLQMILDNESIIFLPPFTDAIHNDAYRFIHLSDPFDAELGFIFDKTRIHLADMKPALETVANFYRQSESEDTHHIVYNG